MTTIKRLDITRLRNIDSLTLHAGGGINLVFGPNGSGKTSILEAIHLLSTGRSFRSQKVSPLIQRGEEALTLFAEFSGNLSLGLQKGRNRKPLLKLQGEKQPNWVEAARMLPVQQIDSATFRLLEGSPRDRRRYLDWGVFHVEPAFVEHWRNSRKSIANRNYLLRTTRPDLDQIRAWNVELSREAALVDQARAQYFDELMPVFKEVMAKVADFSDISLQYRRGWDAETDLLEVLKRSEQSDIRYGATQSGPHRADIIVKHGGISAVDVLSRGQQKILVSALKLAQGIYQSRDEARACIFLIDDLPAELDEENRSRVCSLLASLGTQVFLTCVEERSLVQALETAPKVTKFHVEHGKISA